MMHLGAETLCELLRGHLSPRDVSGIKPSDFADEMHRVIFAIALSLVELGATPTDERIKIVCKRIFPNLNIDSELAALRKEQ